MRASVQPTVGTHFVQMQIQLGDNGFVGFGGERVEGPGKRPLTQHELLANVSKLLMLVHTQLMESEVPPSVIQLARG